MPWSQDSDQEILDAYFGSLVGQWAGGTVTAGASAIALTTSTTRGSIGSGNMDATPANNSNLAIALPGTSNTINQYTNLDVLAITSATATSITFPANSLSKARATGDFIWSFGTVANPAELKLINTWYLGLSTQAVSGATQANVLAGEPTIGTGNYARVPILNNPTNWLASTYSSPTATKTSNAIFAFGQSSAAYSTGSTNLIQAFLTDSPTGTTAGTNTNVFGYGALTVPFAVNSANITVSFAAGQVTVTIA